MRKVKIMKKVKQIICIILAALTIISAPLTSYMEAQAAEAGLWALAQMVENAIISVGFSAAGYIKSNINISDRDFANAFFEYLSSDGGNMVVPLDIDFVQALNDTALIANYKAGDPLHLSNGSITVSGSKKEGIRVEFSKEAAKECGKAARKYLESDANKTDVSYDNDSLSADVGYDDLDITFSSRVITLANYESIYDASDCFSEPALDTMFKENGVSDNTHAVFAYLSGSRITFSCVPIDRCIVFVGLADPLFLSAETAARFMRSFAVDRLNSGITYDAYKQYSSGEAFTLTFNRNSDTWTRSSGVVSYKNYSAYYGDKVFNFQKFMALGGTVQYFNNGSSVRTVLSYKTKGNIISYDTSRAIDYSDGVSFTFSDGDVTNGLDGYDLDTLLSYMSGLSEEMAEWRKQQSANQETIIEQNAEVIQQNKNILTAVGGINSTTAKINTGIGKAVSFLSSIADRLLDLPAAIFNAFSDTLGQFMTAEHLETLINGIPVILAGVLSDAYADTQISVLPGILTDVLSSVFPDAASVFETLADLPAYIISAVSGIQVKVPDITIPEIKVPEVTVPDVYVEAPAITLNPTFDVTVANDYAGLSDVISDSVSGVMVDAFVPSETATLEKVAEMQEYFKFKDDMEAIIYEFKRNIFGIKPSPVLKIPIGKPSSKKYDYGTGNYIIIDASWYAKYKDFGDKIVLAFAWAFFIWRMFVGLPGIISGSVGGLQSIGDAYTVYRKNSSKD